MDVSYGRQNQDHISGTNLRRLHISVCFFVLHGTNNAAQKRD
jgi:hypothetical protein